MLISQYFYVNYYYYIIYVNFYYYKYQIRKTGLSYNLVG